MNTDARRALSQYAGGNGTANALRVGADEWDEAPAQQDSGFRTMGQQLAELGRRFGLRKRTIAAQLRMQASTFSMQVRRGLSLEQMEDIARVAGVHPAYFDEYVAKRFAQLARENAQILRVARLRACAIDPSLADAVDADLIKRLWEAVPGGQPTRLVPKKIAPRATGAASSA
jgi:hypothetical protein